MDADRPTLRAQLWCSATALQHLTRTMAIACVLCLVAEHHSNAEPVNITLTEYQGLLANLFGSVASEKALIQARGVQFGYSK